MEKRFIRLLYRKVIDADSIKAWEKHAFNDSYTEFLMQAQLYSQEKKYSTFSDMVTNVAGAEKLHFLVSASVIGHLKQFNGKVPDIVNNMGDIFLPFKNYRFQIINSDSTNKAKHQVAINFITEPVTWVDTIANNLLISIKHAAENPAGEILTEMVHLQSMLSVYSLK